MEMKKLFAFVILLTSSLAGVDMASLKKNVIVVLARMPTVLLVIRFVIVKQFVLLH